MHIVAGHDRVIADWAADRLQCARFHEPFTAFGIVDAAGVLKGACIFNDYYPGGNVEWTHVGSGSLHRGLIQFMAKFCFRELGAARVTAKTRRSNVLVRRLLPRAGFAFEATQKRYFGPERADDALVFVLTPEAARKWLSDEVRH